MNIHTSEAEAVEEEVVMLQAEHLKLKQTYWEYYADSCHHIQKQRKVVDNLSLAEQVFEMQDLVAGSVLVDTEIAG